MCVYVALFALALPQILAYKFGSTLTHWPQFFRYCDVITSAFSSTAQPSKAQFSIYMQLCNTTTAIGMLCVRFSISNSFSMCVCNVYGEYTHGVRTNRFGFAALFEASMHIHNICNVQPCVMRFVGTTIAPIVNVCRCKSATKKNSNSTKGFNALGRCGGNVCSRSHKRTARGRQNNNNKLQTFIQ